MNCLCFLLAAILSGAHSSPSTREQRLILIKNGTPDVWPTDKPIPYVLDCRFSEEEKDKIREAIAEIEEKTCIRFQQLSVDDENLPAKRINYMSSNRCYTSNIGYDKDNNNYTVIELGGVNDCFLHYVLTHETMHALGFHHELTHPDRDDYIRILWQNIQPDEMYNFFKRSADTNLRNCTVDLPQSCTCDKPYEGNPSCGASAMITNRSGYNWKELDNCEEPFQVEDFGLGYDPYSVMHYSMNLYKNGCGPTFEWLGKNGTNLHMYPSTIGLLPHLSEKDVKKLNMAYNCKDKV